MKMKTFTREGLAKVGKLKPVSGCMPGESIFQIPAGTFKQGDRVRLLADMEDTYAPIEEGETGTIEFLCPSMGQIVMAWDSGRTLALFFGLDNFELLGNKNQAG